MGHTRVAVALTAFFLVIGLAAGAAQDFPRLTGPYLGQETPGLGFVAAIGASPLLRSQDVLKIPHLPLAYEVLAPPTPVRSLGKIHLVYELHLTNFRKGVLTLRSVEALGNGKVPIMIYQGDHLSRCLFRPGRPSDPGHQAAMEGGTRAVLFIMLSFGTTEAVPDFLTHRVTVEQPPGGTDTVLLQGEGACAAVLKKEPVTIGPPVRPGVWLAGNGTGDGLAGHRLSLQPWNGRLVVHQRYALDFMKFGQDRSLARGRASANPDWESYGEEVLAVADGVVSDARGGIVENPVMGRYAVSNSLESAAGNYVILDIGQGAYAVYAHLQPESLRVAVGDSARKGQVLGLIGNSGISDAPHLHFHVIDFNSAFGGEGLPFEFEGFELLGPYGGPDEDPTKSWTPQGESSRRVRELPMGDTVIAFPRPPAVASPAR